MIDPQSTQAWQQRRSFFHVDPTAWFIDGAAGLSRSAICYLDYPADDVADDSTAWPQPMSFNLLGLPWGAREFRGVIDEYQAMLGVDDWPSYRLGVERRTNLAREIGLERAKLLSFLQLTLPGTPLTYCGDELEDHDGESQRKDPASLLRLYHHLLHLRETSDALRRGSYRAVESHNEAVFVFARETSHERCYILLNFEDAPQTVQLGRIGRCIASTEDLHGDGRMQGRGEVHLAPYEGRLYELRSGDGDDE
jgi:glycosidase